jgi:thymidine kinase
MGRLHLFLGPMFSGKTTHLIQQYKKYTYIDKPVAVINYVGDQRYHATMLSTHDKHMIPCLSAATLGEVVDHETVKEAEVILINEGQFFPDLVNCCMDWVERDSKIVYVAGLDGDFRRQKFGTMLDLIPVCDTVTKLHSLCSNCRTGEGALFSHRILGGDSQIVIGSDMYQPLCRACYMEANVCSESVLSLEYP